MIRILHPMNPMNGLPNWIFAAWFVVGVACVALEKMTKALCYLSSFGCPTINLSNTAGAGYDRNSTSVMRVIYHEGYLS